MSVSWNSSRRGSGMQMISDKILRCRKELLGWNRSVFGNVHNLLKAKRACLELLF